MLSLVLCLATVAAWVRSQFTSEWIQWISDLHQNGSENSDFRPAASYVATTTPSKITLERFRCLLRFGEKAGYRREAVKVGEETWKVAHYSAWIGSQNLDTDFSEEWISLPFWFTTLMFVAVFIGTYFSWKLTVSKPGCCPTCNYDLRATPRRCPECGTHFPEKCSA